MKGVDSKGVLQVANSLTTVQFEVQADTNKVNRNRQKGFWMKLNEKAEAGSSKSNERR